MDRLAADHARSTLLGLKNIPNYRRLSEYLARFNLRFVKKFYDISHIITSKIAPKVIEHQLSEKGYVPVFMDGTGIEVSGEYFEKAGTLYDGSKGFWLHNVFIGSLWVGQRLLPGGVDVARSWKSLLRETARVIGDKGPVWAFLDNAYYRKEVVAYLKALGWDFSISVTDRRKKAPIVDIVKDLPNEDWEPIKDDRTEYGLYVRYRPNNWEEEQSYVVIRSLCEGPQRSLWPKYTVILVSRNDIPLREVVKRHRSKQGQENLHKGPLIHLDLHHPPCQKFDANQAYYIAGQIAHNLLVALKFELLPEQARSHSIRTIMRDLVRTGAKLVKKARKFILKFSKCLPDRSILWINHAAEKVEELAGVPT